MAKATWTLLKRTVLEFAEDRVPKQAAALAYYALFAIGPLLLIAVSVAGLFVGADTAMSAIVGEAQRLLGPQGAEGLRSLMEGSDQGRGGILGLVLGGAALVVGALGVFNQLRESLDTIWEVRAKPVDGILRKAVRFLRDNLVGLAGVLGLGFLLLVSLVIGAGISAASRWATDVLPGSELVWQAAHWTLTLAAAGLVFAFMYRFLPRATVAWRDVWIGAALTSVLFVAGEILIGLYIGQTATASRYGAAGTVLVLILWVYYSGLVLFFGAELTQVWANLHGSHIRPRSDAEPIQDAVARRQDLPSREGTGPGSDKGPPTGPIGTVRRARKTPASGAAARPSRGRNGTERGSRSDPTSGARRKDS